MIMFLILMNKTKNNPKIITVSFKCSKSYLVINIFQMFSVTNAIIKKYAGINNLIQIHEKKIQMRYKDISTALRPFSIENRIKKLSFISFRKSSKNLKNLG